jgi:hypothetical protein
MGYKLEDACESAKKIYLKFMDILTVLHIIKSKGPVLSGPVTLYKKSRRETKDSFLWYNIF